MLILLSIECKAANQVPLMHVRLLHQPYFGVPDGEQSTYRPMNASLSDASPRAPYSCLNDNMRLGTLTKARSGKSADVPSL